jgi:predicted enzyme related to lactoylglutathione lyase
MNGVKGCRLVAVNLGAADLARDVAFWEQVFQAQFEASSDPGGRRIVLGEGEGFSLLNLRQRGAAEPHARHTAAFGLQVPDVDAFHARALAAGAIEHFPPTDEPGLPRHSRFADPSGNRVVLWQG